MRLVAAPLVLIAAGCALRARPPAALPPLENEGEVYLYTLPFPREADRLAFTIASITAVRDDGTETPLEVASPSLSGAEMRQQRLLAWARLAPGGYTGFHLHIAKATLESDDGRADLLVASDPVHVDLPLRVTARRATVVSLSFRYEDSLEKRFGFAPLFTAMIPANTPAQLVGYCPSTGMANLAVLDKRTKLVTGVIPTGNAPRGVVLDPTASRAYVALSGEDQLDVVDTAGAESIGRIRLGGGDRPRELALAPDGKLVVVNAGSRTVSFVDPVSAVEIGRVPVGEDPVALLLDRARKRGYVFNRRSNSITVLDVANRSVAATVPTDPEPLRGDVSRDGTRLYVIHAGSAYMTVFSLPDLAVANRVFVGLGATALKVDAGTDLVYVGKDDARVHVYDPFSFLPVDDFDLPDPASCMAIDDVENTLFLLMPARRSIAIVDLASRKTLSLMDVGSEPYDLALTGERR